jgi:hypothetical protein
LDGQKQTLRAKRSKGKRKENPRQE